MAKNKPSGDTAADLQIQRRKAQAALDRNRVETSRGKYRSLKPRERAAYQRIIKRTDKLLGAVSKPSKDSSITPEAAAQGLNALKNFAQMVKIQKERLGGVARKTEK